jgi:hypothetical protein
MRKITKRSAAIVAASVIAVGGGGAAWAFANGWFDGSGSGTAASSEIKPVTADVSLVGKLWPNKAVDATINFGNYNEFPVIPTNVNAASAPVISVFDANGTTPTASNICSGADAKLSLGDIPDTVVNAGTFKQVNAPSFIGMGSDAGPGCANKVFKITFKMDGEIASAPAS